MTTGRKSMVDLQEYCRLQSGDRLVEILLGSTRTSNAIHDCFWGLIFLDFEEEEAGALGPTRNVSKDPTAPKGGGKGKPAQTDRFLPTRT